MHPLNIPKTGFDLVRSFLAERIEQASLSGNLKDKEYQFHQLYLLIHNVRLLVPMKNRM